MNELYTYFRLVLRIRCNAKKTIVDFGEKFGVLPEDAEQLLKVAKDLQLNIVGVCFHVGSGCQEPAVFNRALSGAKKVNILLV